VRSTLLGRVGIFVTGLVLARFIPNRTARRFLLLTVAPAIVAFFLERGYGWSGRGRNREES
jgi:hypothetical protein